MFLRRSFKLGLVTFSALFIDRTWAAVLWKDHGRQFKRFLQVYQVIFTLILLSFAVGLNTCRINTKTVLYSHFVLSNVIRLSSATNALKYCKIPSSYFNANAPQLHLYRRLTGFLDGTWILKGVKYVKPTIYSPFTSFEFSFVKVSRRAKISLTLRCRNPSGQVRKARGENGKKFV